MGVGVLTDIVVVIWVVEVKHPHTIDCLPIMEHLQIDNQCVHSNTNTSTVRKSLFTTSQEVRTFPGSRVTNQESPIQQLRDSG